MKRISLLILSLLFLATAFQSDKLLTSGWYRQYITNLNGSTIKDMTFLDSLTGFAVTNSNTSLQEYILKTTNGGDNWHNVYTYTPPAINIGFTRIQFADNNIGYASVYYFDFFKTTDRGETWTNLPNVPYGAEDMSVVNKDTIFVVTSSGFGGGVYRTTNGGYNWQLIWTLGVTSGNPSKIYMFDKNMGFCCQPVTGESRFRKTTDGGFNWTLINDTNFRDIKFADTLIGYKVFNNSIKKTTDGGMTWLWQIYPNVFSFSGLKLSVLNKDTVWFSGPTVYKNGFPYGVLIKTTNGGLNWGYQIPDTSIRISNYPFVFFTNKNNGWAFQDSNGVHTKIGGNDTTFFTGIKLVPSIVPEKFSLGQNYPNPFNSMCNVKFSMCNAGNVKLVVYDVQGREVQTLVNETLKSGTYETTFDASALATGIYFYQIIISGESTHQTFTATRKMMVLK